MELKRGGQKPSSYIQKALSELFQDKHRKDKNVWREMNDVGQRIDLMINGKQFLRRNPYSGGWGFIDLDGGQRPFNILNNLKQNLLTKWENANPDILIRAVAGKGAKAMSAARAADTINNYYERQFYNSWFTQQEALMGMTFGTYLDRYRFDDSKVSMSVLHDIFETKDVSFGEGYGFCGDCQYSGKASEFKSQMGGDGPLAQAKCPQCRSTAVEVEEGPKGAFQSVSGQQKSQVGDLVCELLPFPACRFDLAKRPEDSSWFMYRQRIPKGEVTRVLGNVLIPNGNTDSDNGLEVLRALQKQGQPLGGRSQFGNQRRDDDGDRDTITFDELWLGPSDYAHINLIGDEETVEGDKLPKGKLIDFFPDGLCAVGLNGMAVVLALYPEKHKSHLVSGTWFMRSQTGAGRGLADVVETQTIMNTLNNQALDYMSSTYTPAIGYDNQIWTGSKMKYIGTPKTNIPFDLTKLPEGRKLHDSIFQFQPTAIPGQFFSFAQDFMSLMAQKQSMVTDFNNGEPGITGQNTTATAAEIDQSNADSINQPIFKIKAEARKRGSEITIDLFRKHFPMKRYFDLGGTYGVQQGIELSSADVCTELVFDVVRNSEMPKGPFERRKNRMQFFGVFGGFEGYAMAQQSMPRLVHAIEQDFDVDLETDDYDAVNELCLKRLHQMEEAAEVGVTDPAVLISAITPPISAVELQLKEKAEWFANWLSEDQGQAASMPLRAACELLAQGQFAGAVDLHAKMAMGEGTIQAAQMAPAMMGQAALEPDQQEETNEPDATAVLQMQQELSQQRHEAKEGQADRDHELEVIAAEGKRDKEVASHDAKEKIKIEKSKPVKPKPAAKKK